MPSRPLTSRETAVHQLRINPCSLAATEHRIRTLAARILLLKEDRNHENNNTRLMGMPSRSWKAVLLYITPSDPIGDLGTENLPAFRVASLRYFTCSIFSLHEYHSPEAQYLQQQPCLHPTLSEGVDINY